MSSYNAVVSVIVHFETYKNIDLTHQGLYYLTATLTSEDDTSKGIPMDIYNPPYPSKFGNEKIDYYNLHPACCDDTTFTTKIFAIHYCEEEIDINDFCEFHLEIPMV